MRVAKIEDVLVPGSKGPKAKLKLKGDGPNTWEVEVDVTLHSETPGDFTVESYLQSTPGSHDLVFYNRHHPGFLVTFNLIDETGLGYQFPSPANRKDGVWSQKGDTCPTAAQPCWDIFEKDSIKSKSKGSMLEAFNPNSGDAVGPFKYTLNVSKNGKPPYLPLDPGGNNMNGVSGRW